jgi:hypothetical protein
MPAFKNTSVIVRPLDPDPVLPAAGPALSVAGAR